MGDRQRDIRISGALKILDADGDGSELGVTKNISKSGLFLLTKRKWDQGTILALTIDYRYWQMPVKARVVHMQEEGAGLEFVDLSDDDQVIVREIVDSLLAEGAWLDDRRNKLRADVSGPVVWVHEGVEYQSELLNLSTGGALIEAENLPAIETDVFLYLPTSGSEEEDRKVEGCQGKVTHQKEEAFGMEFSSPSPEFIEAIESILRAAHEVPTKDKD